PLLHLLSLTLHFLFLLTRRPPRPPLFPYTTLFRSRSRPEVESSGRAAPCPIRFRRPVSPDLRRRAARDPGLGRPAARLPPRPVEDRKSTRLNSSHVAISYAVFCLKKKNKTNSTTNY